MKQRRVVKKEHNDNSHPAENANTSNAHPLLHSRLPIDT